MDTTFILELSIVLTAALLGGVLVRKFGYPAALGELAVGIVLGPFALGFVRDTEILTIFAELGAIILLFYIGLETDINQLKKQLKPSILVGVLGAIIPLILGYYTGLLFGYPEGESLFLGAVMMATSIGITVRMLSELKQLHTKIGMIIMGGGVVDDVVAIILLTVIIGFLKGQVQLTNILGLVGSALIFWILALIIGLRVICRFLNKIDLIKPGFFLSNTENVYLIFISLGLLAAFISGLLGLSTIIGAFAMGIALTKYKHIDKILKKYHSLYLFFVPIFFVAIGMLVNIKVIYEILIPALVITGVGILGKVFGCGIAGLLAKCSAKESLIIGIGMSPRGEVGLVIAGIGLASGLIGDAVFSLAVAAVALSTVIGMPLLKISLNKFNKIN